MTTDEIKTLWHSLPLSKDNDLSKLDAQIELNPKVWEAVAAFLKEKDLNALPLGRNEIGEGAFANVAEYETKLQNMYELHRRYIDVQLLAYGSEAVFVADKDQAREPQGDFNEANDYILFANADGARCVTVSPESYQMFYPSDAHKPSMAVDGRPQRVRKVCVKVPYTFRNTRLR